MSVFKQCDIRGVYGEELDAKLARDLGLAIGARARGQAIVVAGDLRTSTPILKQALVDGLVYGGAKVIDLGEVATPLLYYAKRQLDAWGGVMVTASHNPAQYNGFKLMLGDLPTTPEVLQELRREMARPAAAGRLGTLTTHNITPAYCAMLAQRFHGLRSRRMVVDAGNGSLSTLAPQALAELGMDVVPLFCTPDGTFPNRDPNPAVEAHLTALKAQVQSTGAEMGVAYDGDGDRAIMIDERGRMLAADRVFVLLIRDMLKTHPGAPIVYDLKSSSVVAEEIERLGGRPLMERSGHAFIKRRLMEEKALLGGEVSGHYFFGELQGDDALYATLAILCALDDLGCSLAEAMASVPAYPITPDLRLPCPPDKAQRILDELKACFHAYPQTFVDGIRIQFEDGWALARLSVTEPLITLRFEAHSEDRLQEIKRNVAQAVPELASMLGRSAR